MNKRKLFILCTALSTLLLTIATVILKVIVFEFMYAFEFQRFIWKVGYWNYVLEDFLFLLPYTLFIGTLITTYCVLSVCKERR